MQFIPLYYALVEASLLLFMGILWNEFGYYYYVFHQSCPDWPTVDGSTIENHDHHQQNLTRFMILADTHIMGPIKSFRLDKWRREWQMQQAFRISYSIYRPNVIIFLGDILDEGSFSNDALFDKASQDFERIFPLDILRKQKLIIIPGNHDVGFHDQMKYFPHLLRRFNSRFKTTETIKLDNFDNLNLITSNSMSFYNDTCPICSQSIAQTNQISSELRRTKQDNFGSPILLTHIPLFRKNDIQCDYPTVMKERVKEDNIEGKDVLHYEVSKFLLDSLRPRLILSGHTHMNCKTIHRLHNLQEEFKEITLSSYNHKYAENEPEFMLISANSSEMFTKSCTMINEKVVVATYIAIIVFICARIVQHLNNGGADEQ